MMDRSLMILGNTINNKEFIEKGKNIALTTFWYSYSYQGIHLENSPQYHIMVTRMYNEIEEYLVRNGDSLGELVNNHLKLAKEYSRKMIKPDGSLLSVGDSGKGIREIEKIYNNVYDVESGISILQYESPKPFYVSFICGYSTNVHKHRDDLSITLNYNNKDFLVDPGPFNYSKHKIRKYMTSKEAHSSFYLQDFNYEIKKSNRFDRKIVLENYYESNEFTLVKGIHQDYNGSNAKLTRILIQLKKYPILIIVDDVHTKVRHPLKFVQNYNLSQDVILESDGKRILLKNGDTCLTLKQFNNTEDVSIIFGDKEIPVALNTNGFGKATETHQVKFEKSTNEKNVYLSAIYDETIVQELDLKIVNNYLAINIKNNELLINI